VLGDLQLALARAALLIDDGEPAEAELLTNAAERILAEDGAGDSSPQRRTAEVTVTVQRLHYERLLGRRDGARNDADRLLAELESTGSRTWLEQAHRARLQIGLGLHSAYSGDMAETVLHMRQAQAAAEDPELRYLRLFAQSWLALLVARTGDFDEASRQALEVIDFAVRYGWTASHGLATAYWALGRVHYFRDSMADARRCIEEAASLVPRSEFVTASLIARDHALVLGAMGDVAEAREVLEVAYAAGERWPLPSWLRALLVVAEADQRVSEGEPDAAYELLLGAHSLDDLGDYRTRPVALAEVQLRLGQPLEARRTVAPFVLEPSDALPARVAAVVLDAAAAAELGDKNAARAGMELALDLAAPSQLRRPFVDCPAPIGSTLATLSDLGVPHTDFAVDLLERSPLERNRVASVTSRHGQNLVEPLSERELEVLRYLRTRLSKAEIASQLFVSENTIRTHAKSIYRKLGASDRRHAVSRAHDLKIL
jgi:LuxR family maltose regulon positive regulatory protein